MCIAVYIPKGKTISEQRLREAYDANSDGWGCLYINKKKLNAIRGVVEPPFFSKRRGKIKSGVDIILHFRTASSGGIGIEWCHPFYVNDDLAFVHNGNLFEYGNHFKNWNDNRTDIQRFNDEVLKNLHPDFLYIPEIRQALEKYNRECLSKMVFMDSAGRVNIINEDAGEWVDGVWFSNGGIQNYTGYGYSGAYEYHAGDIRHKGGVITPMVFPKRKNWKRCEQCEGYFYRLGDNICGGCRTLNDLRGFCDLP